MLKDRDELLWWIIIICSRDSPPKIQISPFYYSPLLMEALVTFWNPLNQSWFKCPEKSSVQFDLKTVIAFKRDRARQIRLQSLLDLWMTLHMRCEDMLCFYLMFSLRWSARSKLASTGNSFPQWKSRMVMWIRNYQHRLHQHGVRRKYVKFQRWGKKFL